MQVAVGGPIGSELSEPDTESSVIIGLVAAMIILAFTFGTFVAMGMPILSAMGGLICGLAIIGLFSHVATVPTIVPTLATMIGLGVGTDYALFMVSRYRSNRKDGMEVDEAIARAVATAGSAICFAGGTVVVALVTLLIAGIPLVTTLGYTSAFAVITAVLAALTFLPAVLSLLGDHIESARVPSFMRPKPKEPGRGFWAAWSRFVTGHPWLAVGASTIILVPLIIPLASLKLGQEDIAATPKKTQERQAYDLMARGFGPGYNGPLLVAVSLHPKAKTSNTFFTKKKQAENLQTQLKSEQKSGNKQKKQLQRGSKASSSSRRHWRNSRSSSSRSRSSWSRTATSSRPSRTSSSPRRTASSSSRTSCSNSGWLGEAGVVPVKQAAKLGKKPPQTRPP